MRLRGPVLRTAAHNKIGFCSAGSGSSRNFDSAPPGRPTVVNERPLADPHKRTGLFVTPWRFSAMGTVSPGSLWIF
ncbi:hypothetical protein STEG23_026801 [Scotinomys teguina]